MKKYFLLIIAIFAIACSEEKIEQVEKVIPVVIQKVEVEEFAIPIITSGKISAATETKLSFKTGGIVKSIKVKEGQQVYKNQILAELNLSEINSQFAKATAAYEKAQRDLKRIEALYQDSVVTLEQFQNMQTAFNVAKSDYETAKFNLDYSVIKAPTNGTIYKKLVEANELVGPGNPIIIMGSNTNSWKVKAGITDKDISKVEIGDSAKILIGPQSVTLEGKVTEVGSFANPYNGTYEIEISVSNQDVNLFSGMVVDVEIYAHDKIKRLAIPVSGLVNAEGENAEIFIPVENDKKVKKLKVKIENIMRDKILVNPDSFSSEFIVVDGSEYLSDNSKINVAEKRVSK